MTRFDRRLQQLGTADVCLTTLCEDAYVLPNVRS